MTTSTFLTSMRSARRLSWRRTCDALAEAPRRATPPVGLVDVGHGHRGSSFGGRAGTRTVRPTPPQGAPAERFLYALVNTEPGHEPNRGQCRGRPISLSRHLD